jgi:hypothetical protein
VAGPGLPDDQAGPLLRAAIDQVDRVVTAET